MFSYQPGMSSLSSSSITPFLLAQSNSVLWCCMRDFGVEEGRGSREVVVGGGWISAIQTRENSMGDVFPCSLSPWLASRLASAPPVRSKSCFLSFIHVLECSALQCTFTFFVGCSFSSSLRAATLVSNVAWSPNLMCSWEAIILNFRSLPTLQLPLRMPLRSPLRRLPPRPPSHHSTTART